MRIVGFRGEYFGNEEMTCSEGSMSTLLGVCDSGTQSMIRVTDRGKYINIRYR